MQVPIPIQPLSPSDGQSRHMNRLMITTIPQTNKDEIFFAKNQSPFKNNKDFSRN